MTINYSRIAMYGMKKDEFSLLSDEEKEKVLEFRDRHVCGKKWWNVLFRRYDRKTYLLSSGLNHFLGELVGIINRIYAYFQEKNRQKFIKNFYA